MKARCYNHQLRFVHPLGGLELLFVEVSSERKIRRVCYGLTLVAAGQNTTRDDVEVIADEVDVKKAFRSVGIQSFSLTNGPHMSALAFRRGKVGPSKEVAELHNHKHVTAFGKYSDFIAVSIEQYNSRRFRAPLEDSALWILPVCEGQSTRRCLLK